MFTADYKLAGWVYRLLGFLAIAVAVMAVQPQPAEAFIFRAIGRGILGAGRLVGRAALGAGRFVGRVGLGAARVVGRVGLGAARVVRGAGQFLAGRRVQPIFGGRFGFRR